METTHFDHAQLQDMVDTPLAGYLHARELQSRLTLGLEWLEVPRIDHISGGISGEGDEEAVFLVSDEVRLNFDAILQLDDN